MRLNLFKLEKLKIKAFRDVRRQRAIRDPSQFEAMFNPTSVKQSYGIEWGKKQGLNSGGARVHYARSKPSELRLDLVLDGTGVTEIGAATSVTDRVKTFLDVAFRYNGDIHEPNYLLVEWGSLAFSCRLLSADVNYDLFARDGTPLRATISVTLISDRDAKRRAKKRHKRSPDLTHSRVVREGDTLPLLTRKVYGSSAHYLGVARFNDLDDFRNLTPGREIHFPPLDRLPAS